MHTLNYCDKRESTHNLIEFLLSMSGFNMLSADDLEMLDKIMLVDQYSDGHKFKSDDNIYLIMEGDVASRYQNERGIFQLNHMHTRELFGLFSLTDDSKRAAICTAVGSVTAASLPRSAFELLINSKLPLANHFRAIVNLTHDSEQNSDNYPVENISSLTQKQRCDFRIQ